MKILLALLLCVIDLTGCSSEMSIVNEDTTIDAPTITIDNEVTKEEMLSVSIQTEIPKENDEMIDLNITVNDSQYSAKLYNNETTREWIKQLPSTYDMSEMNGNEKFYYLDCSLPTDSSRPDIINSGDIMLYGSNCVVLFYETFSTSYSYTPLGYIENPTDLADALGSGNATVTFKIR